ncbi:MAG: hypothetical protein K9G58_01625 [Bacteroidales bacterium]|nr:hypothetical protein [Bacteroidales bacterium]MCF8388421.1 hypothetical protein [Bacteroidales bacterium]MCF8396836.1 hypothetical protein [Bacteroidales bacterium]
MQFLRAIIFCGLFCAVSLAYSQDHAIRIGFISDTDTCLTHLYVGDTDYDNVATTYTFNLNNYILEEFRKVFDTIFLKFGLQYKIKSYQLPENIKSSTGLVNFSGKPKKKLKNFISELSDNEKLDFVLVLTSQSLNPESRDAFLNAYDYGVTSYINYNILLTYFTLVDFYLFKTNPLTELDFDYRTNYIKDVKIFDFRLDEKMSLEERKKLPDFHLTFAIDNIKEMISIKIEKILKTILSQSD